MGVLAEVPAHDSAHGGTGGGAAPRLPDDRRARASRDRSSAKASTTCRCGPTTAACTCCVAPGDALREVTSEHVVADLQRRSRRQSLHDADPDQQGQRRRGSRRSGSSRCRARALQVTPVVVDGIMYVTAPNECYALDAGTAGRSGDYQRPRTPGPSRQGGTNRGVGVAGDRVFMVTDHAHLIALNRFTGELLWDTEMADWRQNYSASSAPLAGGQPGHLRRRRAASTARNGFVAALDQATGKEVWRFWTVPKPGEPGSETWQGKDIEHGGAPTWFTGSYDPAARHRLLADRQSQQGIQRRRSQGRQPLRGLHPGARPQDRQAQVALPVHAARSVGLGRDADVRAGRRDLAGTAAQAAAARQPQRVLLRVRPHRRQAAAGEAVRART